MQLLSYIYKFCGEYFGKAMYELVHPLGFSNRSEAGLWLDSAGISRNSIILYEVAGDEDPPVQITIGN